MQLKLFVFGILGFLLLSCSWGSQRYSFEKADNLKTFSVKKNKIFRLELPANITTGYSWNFSDLDAEYFKIVDSGYRAIPPVMPGSGGLSWWLVEPLKTGNRRIKLLYYRHWEGPAKAGQVYSLELKIN